MYHQNVLSAAISIQVAVVTPSIIGHLIYASEDDGSIGAYLVTPINDSVNRILYGANGRRHSVRRGIIRQ
jgi:hypothetical protein